MLNATWNEAMNMLSRSESTVKARMLISSCKTLIMTKSSAIYLLTAYKGAPYEKNFLIKLLQYWKAFSCTILSLCRSVVHHCPVFIVNKYTRLKPRLIKNTFLYKKINLDKYFWSRSNNTLYILLE